VGLYCIQLFTLIVTKKKKKKNQHKILEGFKLYVAARKHKCVYILF